MYAVTRVWIVLLLVLGLVGSVSTIAVAEPSDEIRPIIAKRSFPDPSVAKFRSGLIAVSTGPRAPRAWLPEPGAAWRNIGPALRERPAWSTTGKIWAADIVKARGQWLLYYSITVKGLHRQGRCIGVATASSPLESFVNVGRKPLVCPRKARAPRAYDLASKQFSRQGVIDPSAFVADNGKRYLLYKTQGKPSTIRMVRLTDSGLRKMPRTTSREILRVPATIENPVLVQRKHRFYLFTSEGNYARCGYHTSWRSAARLGRLDSAPRRRLLTGVAGEVCGPGGADIVDLPSGPVVFFHGWTCYGRDRACGRNFHKTRNRSLDPKRSTYAAPLKFVGRKPRAGEPLTFTTVPESREPDQEPAGPGLPPLFPLRSTR